MREFCARQRENLIANLVASAIFAALAAVVTWLADVPPIPVPAWMFIACAGVLSAFWWFSRPNKKLIPVANESYGVERVYVDGKHFTSCHFDGTELVFTGKNGFSLVHCNFNSHHVRFEGAAATVMLQLAALYREPFFKQAIDSTLNQVSDHGRHL